MGCAKMKKLLCHGLAVAMVVSLTATASDSSAAANIMAQLSRQKFDVFIMN